MQGMLVTQLVEDTKCCTAVAAEQQQEQVQQKCAAYLSKAANAQQKLGSHQPDMRQR
jgi:hypothetical protein